MKEMAAKKIIDYEKGLKNETFKSFKDSPDEI